MDRLDEDLKAAMDVLGSAVPAGYFDQLPSRVEARLEAVDMTGSDTDRDAKGDSDTPPPAAELLEEEEHSGLHDIQELARTTKQRISKRISTQSDVEESLLASASHSGLRAVALPDPTKEVKESAPKNKRAAASAGTAAAESAAESEEPSAGIPMWVYAGVAVVAAAAVIFFVIRGKGDKKTETNQVASAGMTEPGSGAQAAPTPTVVPAPAPAKGAMPTGNAAPGATANPESGSGGPATAGATTPPATDQPSASASDPKATATAKPTTTTKPTKVASVDRRRRPTAKPKPKPAARTRPAPKRAGSKPSASAKKPKSMDDLLTSVTGVKKDGDKATPAAPKKPTKTKLSRGDIRSAMNKVKSRATTGCYAKHKESGTVTVFVKVAPSGKISSVSPRGKWKGTPTGNCVASAVRGARFPAWDGRPMSFPWPFLLSP